MPVLAENLSNTKRYQTSSHIRTLDDKILPAQTHLRYEAPEEGCPHEAFSFVILNIISTEEYIEQLVASTEDIKRQQIKARLPEGISKVEEATEQRVVLSAHQLRYLIVSERARDTLALQYPVEV